MGYLNAQSIIQKTIYINDLLLQHDLDVLCVCETWLAENSHEPVLAELSPPGYNVKSFPRPAGGGGGILFIFKDELSPNAKKYKGTVYTTYEAAELTLTSTSTTFKIICIYRPPPSQVNHFLDSTATRELQELLVQTQTSSNNFIILGDWNFHFNKSSSNVRKLEGTFKELNLCQHITEPTHKFGNTLDVLITRRESLFLKNYDVIDNKISDHSFVICDLDFMKPKKPTRTVSSRNLKRICRVSFSGDLTAAIEREPGTMSANGMGSIFRDVLDRHAPVVTRKVSDRLYSPWYCDEIRLAKQRLRAAERAWLKSLLDVHREMLISARTHLKNIVKRCKQNYFLNKFSNLKTCRDLFTASNELLGKTKNELLNVTKPICDKFSHYFVSKVNYIRDSIDSSCSSVRFVDNIFNGSFLRKFNTVTNDYLHKLISSSLPKSCDLDPIPTNLLKGCLSNPCVLSTITNVINESLQSGVVPSCFKRALVRPILKKDGLDENDPQNYRPVSNLPFLSKILEKVVSAQLLDHLNVNDKIDAYQSAYRSHHSTETALIKVSDDILSIMDSRKVCILAMIDLSAAFDTIDHNVLLKRLEVSFGVTGTALLWFDSYLKSRYQAVKIGSAISDWTILKCGVPQGSVLGPMLFTLYTQPLIGILEKNNMHFHLYADDTQIYLSSDINDIPSSLQKLENCIKDVRQWMLENKLKINDEKTELIIFTPPSLKDRIPTDNMHITVNGNRIDQCDKVKNLGVVMDKHMTMLPQINALCKVMYFQIKRISFIRPYLNHHVTKTLVTSLVLSKLDYCNALLSGLSGNQMSKLQIVQNSAARLIEESKKRDHAKPLLKKLHWLPVQERVKYKVALMCFKCINNIAPIYLQKLSHYLSTTTELKVIARHGHS